VYFQSQACFSSEKNPKNSTQQSREEKRLFLYSKKVMQIFCKEGLKNTANEGLGGNKHRKKDWGKLNCGKNLDGG